MPGTLSDTPRKASDTSLFCPTPQKFFSPPSPVVSKVTWSAYSIEVYLYSIVGRTHPPSIRPSYVPTPYSSVSGGGGEVEVQPRGRLGGVAREGGGGGATNPRPSRTSEGEGGVRRPGAARPSVGSINFQSNIDGASGVGRGWSGRVRRLINFNQVLMSRRAGLPEHVGPNFIGVHRILMRCRAGAISPRQVSGGGGPAPSDTPSILVDINQYLMGRRANRLQSSIG